MRILREGPNKTTLCLFCKFIADVRGSVNGAAEPQQCSSAEESFGQSIRLGLWSWEAAVSRLGLPLPV